jgi:hypothetical protein
VVSPNVINDNKTVADWKKVILDTHAAIMGWPEVHYIGRKFKDEIQLGDVVLIARRHRGQPDVVGFGVVSGESEEQYFPEIWKEGPLYVRKLKHFITLQQVPDDIPLLDVLPINRAMIQLHPDEKDAHRDVCEWTESRLAERDKHDRAPRVVPLPKSKKYDYEVMTQEQVKKLQKREEKLLHDYQRWLKAQGRQLVALKYGRNECGAWEAERQNLIEAKTRARREDIRMAVGQLFDYAFQIREKYENPNKAIPLPKEPPEDDVIWLEPLGIKVIWRSGRAFRDNAGGQFT